MYYNELKKIGIDLPYRTTGNVKVKCPKCCDKPGHSKRKDLSVSYDKGYYKCHSSSCNWSGGVAIMKKEYSKPEWKNKTTLSSKNVVFFEKRGISQKTISDLKISQNDKGGIEFNYFRGDDLINTKTRWEVDGVKQFSQHAGAEKILYNLNSLYGKNKAIIVEGEIDVASWIDCGVSDYGVVSVDQGAGVPGSMMDGKLECFKNSAIELDSIESFYICTDKDAPGLYLQEELIRRLGAHRCFVVSLPEGMKDANDVLKEKTISIDARKETLRKCLEDAKPVPVSGIQTLTGEIRDRMLDNFENGRKKGVSTKFSGLDKHFKFLPGDITLFTGIPGHGKSQFNRQLMVNMAVIDGWKWACYTPEDAPAEYFYDDLIQCYAGMNVDKDYANRMTMEQYIEAINFIEQHFIIINPEPDKKTGEVDLPDNKWINSKIRFLKLRYGVNAYVKDPWNKIHHSFHNREDVYLAGELSKEKFFAMDFDAAMYVAHPAKMQKQKDGQYKRPDAYDISGGAMFYNMFDNIISVHRPEAVNNPLDKAVEINILKIKKQKLVGRPGTFDMWFDTGKARYYEVGSDYNPLESSDRASVPDEVFNDLPF